MGHPAGQTGVYRPVSQGLPAVYSGKLTERAVLPICRPGVPETLGPSMRILEKGALGKEQLHKIVRS